MTPQPDKMNSGQHLAISQCFTCTIYGEKKDKYEYENIF